MTEFRLDFEPEPGDQAAMPNGEVGTVIEVLGTAKRRNGRHVYMLRVETTNGLRIWASDDLASLARDYPFEREMDAAIQRELDEWDHRNDGGDAGTPELRAE